MGVYWLIRARSAVLILWIISNMYIGIRYRCDVVIYIARAFSISLEVNYPKDIPVIPANAAIARLGSNA